MAAGVSALCATALARHRLQPADHVRVHGGGSGDTDFRPYAAFMGAHAPAGYMTYLGLDSLNTTAPGAVAKWFIDLNATLCEYSINAGGASCDDWLLVPQIGLSLPHKGKEVKVASGEYDAAIAALQTGLAWLNRPSYLRIGYECNGPWNSYHSESYKGAWKRIVDRLRASPAGNSTAAVWDITCDELNKHMDWYPGDDSVDWWAVNIYSDHSAPSDTGCVKPFLDEAQKRGFPLMFGGAAPRGNKTSDSGTWAEWFEPYFKLLGDYKGAVFTSYIDRNWDVNPAYPGWGDSRVDSPGANASGVSANYAQAMGDARYSWLHRSSRDEIAAALGWTPPPVPARPQAMSPGRIKGIFSACQCLPFNDILGI